MENYFQQLMVDIRDSTARMEPSGDEQLWDFWDMKPDEEEEQTARVINLQVWTGITKEMLPPEDLLRDEQVHELLLALNKLLDVYNWSFVMQIEVPERVQYETIRQNFDQEAKIKTWNMGFFEFCKPGTVHKTCALKEYCHCAFFAEFFAGMCNEELSPEEERQMMLDNEIRHIQRKYDDDWMKYYPYHLDKNYDDENGNPYDYGFDLGDDDEEDWWRKEK